MSKGIAKTEAELISSSRIESALREPADAPFSLALNPGFAMPTKFNEDWSENEKLVINLVSTEFSKLLSEEVAAKKKQKPFIAFLDSAKGLVASLVAAVSVFVPGALLYESTQNLGVGIGIIMVTNAVVMPSVCFYFARPTHEEKSEIVGGNLRKVSSQVRELSEKNYQDVVSRWALQRYGFIMTTRWDSQVKRLADDIIFVGEKDGRKVYCQERSEGWVLTYNNGTELPVLVNEKKLVKA